MQEPELLLPYLLLKCLINLLLFITIGSLCVCWACAEPRSSCLPLHHHHHHHHRLTWWEVAGAAGVAQELLGSQRVCLSVWMHRKPFLGIASKAVLTCIRLLFMFVLKVNKVTRRKAGNLPMVSLSVHSSEEEESC